MDDYHLAEGSGRNLSISNKHAREIFNFIKGMNVDKAINRLEAVIVHKEAVPFMKFNKKIGHRRGMGPGRYPEKASKEIIIVLKNAKNNAINKGLQEEKLIIKEGIVMMDISKRRRVRTKKGGYVGSAKSTSVKVMLTEKEEEEKKPTKKREKTEKLGVERGEALRKKKRNLLRKKKRLKKMKRR